jgi:hypothetical protein
MNDEKPGIYFVCQQPENGKRTTIKIDVDSDCHDVVEAFRAFLLGLQYTPQIIDQYLGQEEA